MRSVTNGRASPITKLPRTGHQFACFCAVGASGYVVNLAVYATLLQADVHFLVAATASFLVAAGNNYVWNRRWTFGARQARLLRQSLRALAVSALSLAANQVLLFLLIALQAGRLPAQAVAILLVTPFSFALNKAWAFAASEPALLLSSRSSA